MAKTSVNLQDGFLNQVRKDSQEIRICLLDGTELRGQVKGFDNFTVVLNERNQQHLIYKHAISHIARHGSPVVKPVVVEEVEIESNNVMAMNNLAWLLTEYQDKHRNALTWAEKGLEINPGYADLIDTRGVIYHRLGQFEQAALDFERCLELYSFSHPALATVHLHFARTLSELKNPSRAADHLQKASQIHKRKPSLSDCLTSFEVTSFCRSIQARFLLSVTCQ